MGEPRHLVGLRPELQQRDPGRAAQRARVLGRDPRRSRHAVLGPRGDRPVSAACRMGLASRAAHGAGAAPRAPPHLAARRAAAGGRAVRPAAAEELAAAQRPWRHSRRSVHDRRAVHRRAAGGRGVLRGGASVPHRRRLAPVLRLRHQHLLAHRSRGRRAPSFRANGPTPRSVPPCMSPCIPAPRSSEASGGERPDGDDRRGAGVGNRAPSRGCRAGPQWPHRADLRS